MAPKKAILTLKDREEIVLKHEQGTSDKDLALLYDVSKKTVNRIIKNKETVLSYTKTVVNQGGLTTKKRINYIEDSLLEKGLYMWFVQHRSLGETVNGNILKEKALLLNEIIGGNEKFTASNGWLYGFQKRHGIHSLSLQGEKLSADKVGSEAFSAEFQELLSSRQFDSEDIYNADKTSLYSKSLPGRTLVTHKEKTASGGKDPKDRVTVMFCANMTGTHKIPLFIIGKSKKPRCMKNVVNLPVIYDGQKSAWMNSALFLKWYQEVFLAEIKKKRQTTGANGKVLLLLDNAPVHPSKDILNEMDDTCEVMYLPPNVTSLIQPMDQGVIEKTQKLYKHSVLREMLLIKELAVKEFSKQFTIKDCCYKIKAAWDSVTVSNLKNAWNKLLNKTSETLQNYQNEEAIQIVKFLNIDEQLENEHIEDWMEESCEGWEQLNDFDILNRCKGIDDNTYGVNDENSLTNQSCDESSNTSLSDETVPEKKLTPQDAVTITSNLMKFCEEHWEFTSEDILLLQRLKETTLDMLRYRN